MAGSRRGRRPPQDCGRQGLGSDRPADTAGGGLAPQKMGTLQGGENRTVPLQGLGEKLCSVPCQAPGHSGEWRMAQAQCNRGPLYPALGVPVGRSPSWGGTHHPAALCSPKEPRREARGPRGGQRYTPESGAEVREGTQRAWGHAGDPPARGRGIAGLPGGPLAAIPLCLHPLPSAIRVRPLTCTETRRGDQRVVHSLGDGTVHVSATSPLRGSEGGVLRHPLSHRHPCAQVSAARHDATFGFSAVFDAGASQEAVFEGSGMRQLVELAIDG